MRTEGEGEREGEREGKREGEGEGEREGEGEKKTKMTYEDLPQKMTENDRK